MLLDIYKYIYKNINKHYLDRYYKYINNSGKNNPAFGTKLLNNGTINKRVPKSDIDIYLQNGWKLGALKRY